ncbi:MAG: DUF305 domain-containing protein [Actinobacteria bacterium]|nr:DUF305 domain-containing protein [Actinomycetota bacterium]
MKRLGLALVSLLILTGCATNSENSNGAFSSQDIMFAEMMIPHHEQAIEMSELALKNTGNPDVLALAEQIRGAQEPEIELMKSWPGVDLDGHAGHTMMGMLDENELEMLRVTTGADFDRLFLEGMIKHHEGAIDMAEMINDSKNPEVAKLGKAIIESQSSEIAAMKALLGK